MPFDYKKEFSEFYLPAKKPSIVSIPAMNFVAVSGKGNPNEEAGEYKKAMELLYGISFTIKMSKMALKKDPNAWQIPKVMKKIFQREDCITRFIYLTQEKLLPKNLEQ